MHQEDTTFNTHINTQQERPKIHGAKTDTTGGRNRQLSNRS